MKNELFIIAPGLWSAATSIEIAETCSALRELGAYSLPYDSVTVRIRAKEFISFRNVDKGLAEHDALAVDVTVAMDGRLPSVIAINEISGYRLDVTRRITGFSTIQGRRFDAEDDVLLMTMHNMVRDFLITVLATRNVVKQRSENKLARLGIGKAKRRCGTGSYRYVTTISLPHEDEMEDDTEHAPTGKTKAPHLRRGHIRNQHYGPARAFIKRVWIAPVFVNADPDFVSTRKAYNVSIPASISCET